MPVLHAESSKTICTLSQRGHGYATGPKKALEDVINNLWDPEDNPDGILSLGVAENVKFYRNFNT